MNKPLRKEEVWLAVKTTFCDSCGRIKNVVYIEGKRELVNKNLDSNNSFSRKLACLDCMKFIPTILEEESEAVVLGDEVGEEIEEEVEKFSVA